jgi:hypothetical protein
VILFESNELYLRRGADSQDASRQNERAKTVLAAVYMQESHIPFSPHEPQNTFTETEYQMKVIPTGEVDQPKTMTEEEYTASFEASNAPAVQTPALDPNLLKSIFINQDLFKNVLQK